MKNEFKVGDTVKMSNVGKKQYQDAKYNPYDLTGVITKINSIIVKWSNEETNSYDSRDIELVEPKQEQYYTSIPASAKSGDKFEIISKTGYDKRKLDWIKDWKIGDIVTLDYYIESNEPWFINSSNKGQYMNWGCLKPVKDDDYKVGDWVLLIDKNFNSHVSDMNKFKGTIQQIGSTNKYSKDIFYLKDDDKMWAFVPSDFVKKVDAPVTQSKLVDVHHRLKLINNNKTNNNNGKSNSTTSNDLRTAFSPDIRSKEIYAGQVFSEFNLPQIWSGH